MAAGFRKREIICFAQHTRVCVENCVSQRGVVAGTRIAIVLAVRRGPPLATCRLPMGAGIRWVRAAGFVLYGAFAASLLTHRGGGDSPLFCRYFHHNHTAAAATAVPSTTSTLWKSGTKRSTVSPGIGTSALSSSSVKAIVQLIGACRHTRTRHLQGRNRDGVKLHLGRWRRPVSAGAAPGDAPQTGTNQPRQDGSPCNGRLSSIWRTAAMCAGVVPQHPPMIRAPVLTTPRMASAKSAGDKR